VLIVTVKMEIDVKSLAEVKQIPIALTEEHSGYLWVSKTSNLTGLQMTPLASQAFSWPGWRKSITYLKERQSALPQIKGCVWRVYGVIMHEPVGTLPAILLVQRGDSSGSVWSIPGIILKQNEHLVEESLCEAIDLSLGLVVSKVEEISAFSTPVKLGRASEHKGIILLVYRVVIRPDDVKLGAGCRDWRWIGASELKEIELAEHMDKVVRKVLGVDI
jgi:ADP-ribose pyrophosphatase YjhB (NUDIX family)